MQKRQGPGPCLFCFQRGACLCARLGGRELICRGARWCHSVARFWPCSPLPAPPALSRACSSSSSAANAKTSVFSVRPAWPKRSVRLRNIGSIWLPHNSTNLAGATVAWCSKRPSPDQRISTTSACALTRKCRAAPSHRAVASGQRLDFDHGELADIADGLEIVDSEPRGRPAFAVMRALTQWIAARAVMPWRSRGGARSRCSVHRRAAHRCAATARSSRPDIPSLHAARHAPSPGAP